MPRIEVFNQKAGCNKSLTVFIGADKMIGVNFDATDPENFGHKTKEEPCLEKRLSLHRGFAAEDTASHRRLVQTLAVGVSGESSSVILLSTKHGCCRRWPGRLMFGIVVKLECLSK